MAFFSSEQVAAETLLSQLPQSQIFLISKACPMLSSPQPQAPSAPFLPALQKCVPQQEGQPLEIAVHLQQDISLGYNTMLLSSISSFILPNYWTPSITMPIAILPWIQLPKRQRQMCWLATHTLTGIPESWETCSSYSVSDLTTSPNSTV